MQVYFRCIHLWSYHVRSFPNWKNLIKFRKNQVHSWLSGLAHIPFSLVCFPLAVVAPCGSSGLRINGLLLSFLPVQFQQKAEIMFMQWQIHGNTEKEGVTVIRSKSQCEFEEVSGSISCLWRLFHFNPFTIYSDLSFSLNNWYNLWFIYSIMQHFASLSIFALLDPEEKFSFLLWPEYFPVLEVFHDKCAFRTADFRMVCNILLAAVQLSAELYVFYVFRSCRVVWSVCGSHTLRRYSDTDGKGSGPCWRCRVDDLLN